MTRVRRVLVPVMALALGAALATAAVAQAPQGAQRGFGGGLSRGSLLGLLRLEQVQKELKLSEENVAKVTELREKLGAEMQEKFTALREIDDREQRRTKRTELGGESDRKAREQLREVLSREQIMRLYQIRMQVRGALASLNNRFVVRRLELTEEQQTKLSGLQKETRNKTYEMRQDLREQSQEQRREAMQKLRQARNEANEKALGLLTDEQKSRFEEMKGEKFELQRRARRQ